MSLHQGRPARRQVEAEPLHFHPVTTSRLPDLRRFAAEHGKFGWCSCMRWRMTSTEFHGSTRAGRASKLKAMVAAGMPVGVLAYRGDDPVGWCSIAPRETYQGLERYRALPRLDEQPVWSVVCFYVDRRERRSGITLGLVKAAVAYAQSLGAGIIEAYPVEPGARLYTYMGSPSTFRKAGFRDVTPRGQARRVMRYLSAATKRERRSR
jgi:GNAT superfamily N-acetyltransferase